MAASEASAGVGIRDFAEADLFGLFEIGFVGFVEALFLGLVHLQAAADFVADDLLGEDLVSDLGFEVFEADALLAGCFFEGVEVGEVVLFADLIEAADDLGVGVEAEFFSAADEELLVDHVAEEIFFALFALGGRCVLLLELGLKLLLAALEVAAINDLIVDPGDDVFDYGAVCGDGGWCGEGCRGGRSGEGALIAGRLWSLGESADAGEGGRPQGSGGKG